MYIPDIELHEAATREQATELMQHFAPNARLLAGGTDLLVDLKTGRVEVDHVISINRIASLRGVDDADSGLRIGALTTITQLGTAPIVNQRFAPLLDATREMAAPQIRNVATIGGNVASAVPCADLPPILMVLGGSATLHSLKGERTVPLASFFVGPRRTVLFRDELLTAIDLPEMPAGFGAAYARLAVRDGNAIAVAGVAAGLLLNGDNTIKDARLALGAVAPIPKLVESAASALIGQPADDDAFNQAAVAAAAAAEPISDVRASADYRRDMVAVLARRALAKAATRAQERAR
ncbi:MAG: FAD binding domain-containing protein [Planctomycetota bacterium]